MVYISYLRVDTAEMSCATDPIDFDAFNTQNAGLLVGAKQVSLVEAELAVLSLFLSKLLILGSCIASYT